MVKDELKVVITGGSGFLARRIVRRFQEMYQIVTPTHQEFDITDEAQCMAYLQEVQPDIVLHCAAISNTTLCETDPALSRAVNVAGTLYVANACKAVGARLVYASSDQVYNGNKTSNPGLESDVLNPVNVYGRDKLKAECAVLEIAEGICLRLPWMCDRSTTEFPHHADFYSNLCEKIERGEEMVFSPYDYRSITNVNDIVEHIMETHTLPSGVYNFAATGQLSAYEIARGVVEGLYPDDVKIQELVCKNEQVSIEQGRNITMDMGEIGKYGIRFDDCITSVLKLKN